MNTSNIELFDELTGRILARLYQSFPIPIDLKSSSFFPQTHEIRDDITLDERLHLTKFFYATTLWLATAGYTSGSNREFSYSKEVVLTAKGLEVLKGTPSSISTEPSIGEQLAEAAKEEGKETLKNLVKVALSHGVKLIGPVVGLS